jgi:hypothetical protein
MSFMAEILVGKVIDDVYVDPEVVYIMLADGTQISIKGLVVVEPRQSLSQIHLTFGVR